MTTPSRRATADDLLDGGPGNDELTGGGGDDPDGIEPSTSSLTEGNDELTGGGGDDVLDGGPGDDKLLGDLAERVARGAGNDTLRGGAGVDHVFGGPCTDRLDAGGGADVVLSLDHARDEITCGAGTDRLLRDTRDPVKPASCERVQLGATLALASGARGPAASWRSTRAAPSTWSAAAVASGGT